MLVIVGYLIILFSVFGGFALSGGHLYALFQPIELLMLGGAALGSFVVANDMKIIKATILTGFSSLKGLAYSRKFHVELLSMLFEITNKIRKDGAIAIESDVEDYKNSPLFSNYKLVQKDKAIMDFVCDNLRLIILGKVDVHHLENLMDHDIETIEHEISLPIGAISKVADALPAFGIVAAVMGVVHTMESIGIPPEQLGGLIAKALVGTFLGVLMSYGFVAPVAALLELRANTTVKILHACKIILLASASGFAPAIAIEFGRKVLYCSDRPDSKELEEIIRDIKSSSAGAA